MPKRKRGYSDDDYESLAKQVKKLQRIIKRRRQRRSRSDSVSEYNSDSDSPQTRCEPERYAISVTPDDPDLSQPGCSYWETNIVTPAAVTCDTAIHATQLGVTETQTANTCFDHSLMASGPIAESLTAGEQNNTSSPQEQTPELDPDLLDILGEDPTSSKEFGKDVQKDLAIRLNHIATSGLSKEVRKELKEKYLIPANCKLIRAPTLNPEIQAALQESQAKRDKGIEYKQTLTSCALSSLAEAITLLLSSEHKNPDLLKILMDTARMLSDVQHTDSMSRRYFILSTVNKQMKDQLEKTKIDETLFGNSLAETVKSAKNILTTGAQLKSTAVRSVVNNRGKTSNRQVNYRAPPATSNRRPPQSGGARNMRAAAPATRHTTTRSTTHHSASKMSSRHQPTRSRR